MFSWKPYISGNLSLVQGHSCLPLFPPYCYHHPHNHHITHPCWKCHMWPAVYRCIRPMSTPFSVPHFM